MTAALIMAGGRGERMRAGGTSIPKPLVPIRGIPLLERNLLALLHSGFRDITIALPAHTPEIAAFVRERCARLAAGFGGRLGTLVEREPLGNIGAAAELSVPEDGLLIVYADNLTALDLNSLVLHHNQVGAALTSAVHLEPFRIPFGEVDIEDGWIVSYREKPEHQILVSSGLFVLSRQAAAYLQAGQPSAVAALVNRLLSAGERIAAFVHSDPWIDVNDLGAVARAEQMLIEQAEVFERFEAHDLTAAGES